MSRSEIFKLAWMIARELAAMCLSLTGAKVGPKKYFSMALKAAWKYFKLVDTQGGNIFRIIGRFERTEDGGLKIFLPGLQEGSPDLKWLELKFDSLEEACLKINEEVAVDEVTEQELYQEALSPDVTDDYSDVDNPEGLVEFEFFSYGINQIAYHPQLQALANNRALWRALVGHMVRVFLRYKCGLHFDIPLREMPRLLPSRISA